MVDRKTREWRRTIEVTGLGHLRGIGPENERKLVAAGIDSLASLARLAGDAAAARVVVDRTGFPHQRVLRWANDAGALSGQALERRRPTKPEYFMNLAMEVRTRANCTGRKVGAVLIKDDRIVSTGYNGTPGTMTNCADGGCYRCAHPEEFSAGQGYDVCICVHAEQNALLAAARFGIAVEGCALYSTLQPCFGCLKEALQARVMKVVYLRQWRAPQELRQQYGELVQALGPGNFDEFAIDDPDEAWATGKAPALVRTTGHTL